MLSVAVSPTGDYILSGSKDRGVSFWTPSTASAAVVLQGHKNSVISIAVSEVGNLLATGSGDWSCRVCVRVARASGTNPAGGGWTAARRPNKLDSPGSVYAIRKSTRVSDTYRLRLYLAFDLACASQRV